MISMIVALALSSAALAQDSFQGVYETECSQNLVQVGVKAGHTTAPDGILYVDAFTMDLGCTGEITQAQLDVLHTNMLRSCRSTSPGFETCRQLTDDAVDVLGRVGGIGPVDDITVGETSADDKGFVRARMRLDLEGKEEDAAFQVRIQDDGRFGTARRIRRTDSVEGLTMACASRQAQAAYGRLDTANDTARVDYRHNVNLHCTSDQEAELQREVWLDLNFISRAQ